MELGQLVDIDTSFPVLYNTGTGAFSHSNPPIVRIGTSVKLEDLFSASSGADWWSLDASGSLYRKVIVSKQISPENDIEITVSNIVQNVKDTFGFTQEDLASVCCSSRKSVNNWLNGEKPNKTKIKRLMDLFLVRNEWISSGLSTERGMLDLAVLDGHSVMDLLSMKQLDKDKVLFAGSRLSMNISQSSDTELEDPFA